MKITNMKQVKENVGKKVLFQDGVIDNPVEATIVFGYFTDCEGDTLGFRNEYSVVYDEKVDGYTWYGWLSEECFEKNILVFETIG